MTRPDFFLASLEGYGMEAPRRGFRIRRLCGDHRDDYLLARIEPPVARSAFGLGANDIDHVILASRHVGESLFPIERWPVFVHVARPLVPIEGRDLLTTTKWSPSRGLRSTRRKTRRGLTLSERNGWQTKAATALANRFFAGRGPSMLVRSAPCEGAL